MSLPCIIHGERDTIIFHEFYYSYILHKLQIGSVRHMLDVFNDHTDKQVQDGKVCEEDEADEEEAPPANEEKRNSVALTVGLF